MWTMMGSGILRVFRSINELVRVPPLHLATFWSVCCSLSLVSDFGEWLFAFVNEELGL